VTQSSVSDAFTMQGLANWDGLTPCCKTPGTVKQTEQQRADHSRDLSPLTIAKSEYVISPHF